MTQGGHEKIQSDDADVVVPAQCEFIFLDKAVAPVCASLTQTKAIGNALDTRGLDDEQALGSIDQLEEETGLPVQDVVRFSIPTHFMGS